MSQLAQVQEVIRVLEASLDDKNNHIDRRKKDIMQMDAEIAMQRQTANEAENELEMLNMEIDMINGRLDAMHSDRPANGYALDDCDDQYEAVCKSTQDMVEAHRNFVDQIIELQGSIACLSETYKADRVETDAQELRTVLAQNQHNYAELHRESEALQAELDESCSAFQVIDEQYRRVYKVMETEAIAETLQLQSLEQEIEMANQEDVEQDGRLRKVQQMIDSMEKDPKWTNDAAQSE